MAEVIKQLTPQKNGRKKPRDYTYFERNGYNIYGHPDMVITCIKCNETKNQKHFGVRWRDQHNIRHLLNVCNPCKGYDASVRKKIKKELKGPIPKVCEICEKINYKIQIDHNHYTEKFRGFLCNSCNSSIGKFNDDPSMVIKAIKYLMKDGYYDKQEVSLKLRTLASELDNV